MNDRKGEHILTVSPPRYDMPNADKLFVKSLN